MNMSNVIRKKGRVPNVIDQSVQGNHVTIDSEEYYQIANCHLMPEFFMSLTTSSDHWMFVSSNGALTAGRKDPDHVLFPYYSADKISDMAEVTGPKTLIRAPLRNGFEIWEPFAHGRAAADVRRNLYKNPIGNKLIFEEVNARLQLCFRYQWTFSHRFGFVRSCSLKNFGSDRFLEVLDGLQNVMPYGVDQNFQMRFSNLADAYKKNERLEKSNLGLYYLSSIPTDRAEPNEGLRCTVVWQEGLSRPNVLLSDDQVQAFCSGDAVRSESDVRGKRGSYFVTEQMTLLAGDETRWQIVANIDHDQTDVVNLQEFLTTEKNVAEVVSQSVQECQNRLTKIVSATDGRQMGARRQRIDRHQSNALFNVMRGGFPATGYEIDLDDFERQIGVFSRTLLDRSRDFLRALPSRIELRDLVQRLREHGDSDLIRAGLEYLPFTFGRRHGDPTRPWNTFSISPINEDGTAVLNYQGNWRDIFQNWEALSLSYPEFIEGMIFRFVNASTADGYNPYRVTRDGFDWESPDPQDPWANIGYWGDHQIIYLLKLLEWGRNLAPTQMDRWLSETHCRYAEVPYRIRGYTQILDNPQKTIDFDVDQAERIRQRVEEDGTDGKLLKSQGEVCRVTLAEKLLITAITKMTNFVPGGGIWLNTQRPEWNDANNALVGHGLSMVTVYYLRRYFQFMIDWFQTVGNDSFLVSQEVVNLLDRVENVLSEHQDRLNESLSTKGRKAIVDGLSEAGSTYRQRLYDQGLSGEKIDLSRTRCMNLFSVCLSYLDDSIRQNRRNDGLFHSYNLLAWETDDSGAIDGINVEPLYEMLEGQVAVLSSGFLDSQSVVEVLDSLRNSSMYRADQQSYMLYPDRDLPRFVEKNRLPDAFVQRSTLLQTLLEHGDDRLVRRDCQGSVHFNGDIRNADCLLETLSELGAEQELSGFVQSEKDELLAMFAEVFDHSRFTGRSGTFFGYEGLGSIYWHMVSKLLLAATENAIWAKACGENPETIKRIEEHCREIRDGIAGQKSPKQFGAFPTDPYSHTPRHAGAQQPGMTGQVKEDLLARFLELGIRIDKGRLRFDTQLFDASELLQESAQLEFFDLAGDRQCITLGPGSFGFTFCQVPIVYHESETAQLILRYDDGSSEQVSRLELTCEETRLLFRREGRLKMIEVKVPLLRNTELG